MVEEHGKSSCGGIAMSGKHPKGLHLTHGLEYQSCRFQMTCFSFFFLLLERPQGVSPFVPRTKNDSGGPDEVLCQARNPQKEGALVESPWDMVGCVSS